MHGHRGIRLWPCAQSYSRRSDRGDHDGDEGDGDKGDGDEGDGDEGDDEQTTAEDGSVEIHPGHHLDPLHRPRRHGRGHRQRHGE